MLKMDGASMKEVGIDPGDLVVIRRQDTARPGDIIVAMLDGETTLKRFLPEEGRIVLHPENRDFADIVVEGERILRFVIQGVAVRIVKAVR